MKSFIACTSKSGRSNRESILLNPSQLSEWYGFGGPLKVVKTKIAVKPEEQWSIILDDGQNCVTLLSSSDINCEKSTVIDLVAELGHGLTLTPWQKLCFRTDGYCGIYVTYLIDNSLKMHVDL